MPGLRRRAPVRSRSTTAMNIGIVGGGATGITVLSHLSDVVMHQRHARSIANVYIFDKSGFDGGLAYRTTNEHHLLNMRISTMSAKAGQDGHFLSWLRGVGIPCGANDHLPRHFYKSYLDHLKDAAIQRCRAAGVRVHEVADEVVRLDPLSDERVRLRTSAGARVDASVVVLCTGHNDPDDHYGLVGARNYRRDPYGPIDFPDGNDVAIGILGTGLTAVDNVIALADALDLPSITAFSRSGLFPRVQPPVAVAPDPAFRSRLEGFIAAHVRITADALVGEIEAALRDIGGIAIALARQDRDVDGAADLARSIAAARSGAPVDYSYLSRISDVMCEAWTKLNGREKRRFLDVYYSGWMRHRHAMPLVNAEKLLAIARSGRLAVAGRLRSIICAGERFEAVFGGGERRAFDYVVAATGPSYAVPDCPLYADLVRQGLVAVNAFGGISCDYRSGQVLDREGKRSRHLYAVGSLTRGTHFYAAAVDVNLSRAEAAVGAILLPAGRVHPLAEPAFEQRHLAAGD